MITDWYEEGRRWYDRWLKGGAVNTYGTNYLTHLRALRRLATTSDEQIKAEQGWRNRAREINLLPTDELIALIESRIDEHQ